MFALLLLVLGVSRLADSTLLTCPPASEGSAIKRLKSSLFCDYDPQERPVKNREDNVTVNLFLTIRHLSFLDYQNKYEISTYFAMIWNDEHLIWDSDNFENIKIIDVPSNEIWFPDLTILSSDMKQHGMRGENLCKVSSTGSVFCVPRVTTIIYCQQKLAEWPFDKQRCELSILSYSQSGGKMDLTFYGEGIDDGHTDYFENNDWKILNVNATRSVTSGSNVTWVKLNYAIDIQRHADLYALAIVVPAFVMSALTLINFFVRGVMCRVCLCCTALLGDILCLLFIGLRINASGTTTPKIALFYRDAILMTILALVLGVCVERLREGTMNIAAPVWLVRGSSWLQVRGGRAGLLLLGDEGTQDAEIHNNEGKTSQCISFANLLDRVTFLAFLVTFSVTLSALLP